MSKFTETMPCHLPSFAIETSHFTTLEIGAYHLLWIAMWKAGGELPNDDKKLARYTRLTPSKWLKIKEDILACFDVLDQKITQKRVKRELDYVQRKSQKQSQNRTSKSLKNNDSPSTMDTTKRQPNINQTVTHEHEHSKKTIIKKISYSKEFEEVWLAKPRTKDPNKKRAFAEFKKLTPDERQAALLALPSYRADNKNTEDRFKLQLVNWLKGRCWEAYETSNVVQIPHFTHKRGTPEFEAWDEYWKANKGKSIPHTQSGDWSFPSEWPPGYEQKEKAV